MKTTISPLEFDECVSQYKAGVRAEVERVRDVQQDSDPVEMCIRMGVQSMLNYLGVRVEEDRTEVWVLSHDAVSTDGFTWVSTDLVTVDEMVSEFTKEVSGWGIVVPIKVRLVRMWVPEVNQSRITQWLDNHAEVIDNSLTVRQYVSPDYEAALARWGKS